ncbi:MAG: hypothetical protein F4221_03860 [Rhodothermaceae bacterium]|nr:hypothetical protein [Rhodothermaceae bacterium]
MEKLKGGPVSTRAFIPVSEKDIEENQDIRRGSILTSGYRARILSGSNGVAILSTGEILHFPQRMPLRKDFEPWVELFDQDGTLLGYGPLQFDDPELNGDAHVMESVRIQWIDADDRLYFARRNREGFFVLSIAELAISSL